MTVIQPIALDESSRLIADGRASPHHIEIAKSEQQSYQEDHNLRLSLQEVLRRNAFLTGEDGITMSQATAASDANGPLLRSLVNPELCNVLGIYLENLIGERLTVAAMKALTDEHKEQLIEACQQAGFKVQYVTVEARDRSQIMSQMRSATRVSADQVAAHIADLNRNTKEGSYVQKAYEAIVTEGLQLRASDIHVDVHDKDATQCRIVYRVDGHLIFRHLLKTDAIKALATRFKHDGGMDPSARETPQNGRLSFTWHGREIDIRVNSLPITGGETVCLRLLDAAAFQTTAELFQFNPQVRERLAVFTASTIKDPAIIILSGPTGHGKSTTAFAIVADIDRAKKNVMTVENPVELRMRHIRQAEVKKDVPGRTAPELVQELLRQDPDVIYIGEIRESQTAEAAMAAAETGHRVIFTQHSNTAAQTIDRQVGLFTESYRPIGTPILANSLYGIINQRLAPRVCPNCSTRVRFADAYAEIPAYLRRNGKLPLDPDLDVAQVHEGGCDICHGSGYRGRILVPECLFLPKDEAARDEIADLMNRRQFRDVIRVKGTVHTRRSTAAIDLLHRGVIDVRTCLAFADDLPS